MKSSRRWRNERRGRTAGAPISWGIIEIPDWGYQMSVDRLLREAAAVGLEAGPEGFLPEDPEEIYRTLAKDGLGLVGGFVPAVLHSSDVREAELASVEQRAKIFSAAGAEILVLAAFTGSDNYEEIIELGDEAWEEFFENLSRVEEIASQYGLTVALHPNYGTVIERDDQRRRFLEGCDTGLCMDTGHLVIGGSDPVRVAEQAADRVNHVHLKDVDQGLARRLATRELGFKAAAQRGVFRPLGDGDVDLGRLLEHLERAQYRGWYVLEQDIVVDAEPPEGEGPVTDVRKSLQFLEEQPGRDN
jgi:inosose dehydratase